MIDLEFTISYRFIYYINIQIVHSLVRLNCNKIKSKSWLNLNNQEITFSRLISELIHPFWKNHMHKWSNDEAEQVILIKWIVPQLIVSFYKTIYCVKGYLLVILNIITISSKLVSMLLISKTNYHIALRQLENYMM